MAVVILRHPRMVARPLVATLPHAVVGAALVPPLLDLLAQLQREPLLSAAAFGASIVAAGLLLSTLALAIRTPAITAAVLAMLASLALRFVGADSAPLLSVAAVLALGLGGAFKSESGGSDLLGGRPLVETTASEPTRLERAA